MNKHLNTLGKILILGISIIVIAVVVTLLATRPANAPVGEGDPVQAQQNSLISFDNLVSGQTINPPFVVTGIVTGWFFEGSFPVFMYDNANNQIGVALASSSQDWMTADPIPFSVTIPNTPYQGPGTIVFKKDNPSGEPQFDDMYVMNVVFQ
jgi:hypothetical protein